jgi:uncharacterized protein (TIGR02301 family)
MIHLSRPAALLVLAALTAFYASSLPLVAAQPAKPAAAPTAPPPPAEEKPAPYDSQLTRLAEVLGSISYLRQLCGAEQEDWRAMMAKLLDSDTANEPRRRERLTAAFNRGYRSFAAVHTTCTDSARAAEQLYRNEGATLAAEIAGRFGN